MQVSIEGLDEFAQAFWEKVGNIKVFAFHGPMGAGKTTLITALGRKKGIRDQMSSPTFSIINQYAFRENGMEKTMYHIDLYRIEKSEEAVQAGIDDAIDSGALCMVEWPQKAPELFDELTAHVFIEPVDASNRMVRIELPKQS